MLVFWGLNAAKGVSEINNSVYSWRPCQTEKSSHIVAFPWGLHTMARLKKVEKRGELRYLLFPLSLADSRVKSLHLPSPLISHSRTLLSGSAPVSRFPGGCRGLENRNEKQGIWSPLLQGEKKFIYIKQFKSWPESCCGLSEKLFITFRTTS